MRSHQTNVQGKEGAITQGLRVARVDKKRTVLGAKMQKKNERLAVLISDDFTPNDGLAAVWGRLGDFYPSVV